MAASLKGILATTLMAGLALALSVPGCGNDKGGGGPPSNFGGGGGTGGDDGGLGGAAGAGA